MNRTPSRAAVVGLAARWLVGGAYLWMGLSKAIEPVNFLKLLHQYNLALAPWLLNLIAATLPWFEVVCGLLLLLGVAVRGTTLVSVGMLVPFTVVVLHRALALQAASGLTFCAIRFDCGCGAGEVFICRKLTENTVLIVCSLGLMFLREHRLSLRPDLFRPRSNTQAP